MTSYFKGLFVLIFYLVVVPVLYLLIIVTAPIWLPYHLGRNGGW